MADEHEILEQSRSAAIKTAANALELLAEARRQGRRVKAALRDHRRPEPDPNRRKGDFLFDMMKLHAEYLNKLAELSEDNASLGRRAIENFYARLIPRSQSERSAELLFDRTTLKRKFIIENRISDRVNKAFVAVEPLCGPKPSKEVHDCIQLTVGAQKPKKDGSIRLPFGRSEVVNVTVQLESKGERKLKDGRVYSTEITVRIGESTRTIPVVVDLRPKTRRRSRRRTRSRSAE